VSQADGAALLRVADLAVARGGVTLLERVGFALAPGEVLIVKGPNGIGKTTLLRWSPYHSTRPRARWPMPGIWTG
jgi:ABC-type molybdenum transport system ATPase subunit/photorepair protein PhrA